jgi:hypothetical protein
MSRHGTVSMIDPERSIPVSLNRSSIPRMGFDLNNFLSGCELPDRPEQEANRF